MKRLSTFIIILSCWLTAFAQERTITGVVMDGEFKGETLAGATVALSGNEKDKGTVTGADGKFTLTIPSGAKALVASYMGYETVEIPLQNGVTNYTITLHFADKALAEFVVTGYQQIDRRKLTAAVTTVNISDEAVGAVKNIDQALAGQVAGLSAVAASGAPGAPMKIRIRGTSSINVVQEPLWVLDGIPM